MKYKKMNNEGWFAAFWTCWHIKSPLLSCTPTHHRRATVTGKDIYTQSLYRAICTWLYTFQILMSLYLKHYRHQRKGQENKVLRTKSSQSLLFASPSGTEIARPCRGSGQSSYKEVKKDFKIRWWGITS